MNTTLNELRAFLTRDREPERLLLVPSKAMGNELLDAYAAVYKGVMGLRVETPASWALELCSSTGKARRVLYDQQLVHLIYGLLDAYLAESQTPAGYFHSLDRRCLSLGTARSLLQIFYLLEDEGKTPKTCRIQDGENPRLDDLKLLFRRYCDKKKELKVWDRCDLLHNALKLAKDGCRRLPTAACSNLMGRGLAKHFVKALDPQVIPVPMWKKVTAPKSTFYLDQTYTAAPENLRFCRCYNADSEASFPFYDLLNRKAPLGEVALVYADSALLPKLYTQAQALGLPITLDRGLPLSEAPLVQLLDRLVEWHRTGCRVEDFSLLVQDGLQPPHAYALVKALRRRNVGFGQDRYEAFLEKLDPADEKTQPWTDFFQALFSLFDTKTTAKEGYATLWKLLTKRYIPGAPATRALEFSSLMNLGAQLLADMGQADFPTFLTTVLKLADQTTWLSSGPRDGAIHAAPLSKAALLGRKHVYILGLGPDSLESRGAESPLLRDDEREAMDLPRSDAQLTVPACHFAQVLAGLDDDCDCVLSYTCCDPDKDMKLLPNPLYDVLKGKRKEETFDYLHPVGFTAADLCLNKGEAPDRPDPDKVKEPDMEAFVKTHNFSASALETALECPLKFYCYYVLGIPQSPIPQLPEESWLPPNGLGTLVHETLERYFNGLRDGQKPDLDELLKDELEQAKGDWPCVNSLLMEADSERVKGMVRQAVDLYEAQQTSDPRTVQACELSFGAKDKSFSGRLDGKDITLPEDFTLTLGKDEDLTIHLQGSVDRLDKLASGDFCIVDYKTGSAGRFLRDFGHKLQYCLYAKAVEKLLGVKVKRAEYLLLRRDGYDLKTVEDPADDPYCNALLKQLLTALKEGSCVKLAHPAWTDNGPVCDPEDGQRTKELSNCKYFCDYYPICKEAPHDE